jgi:hypothetical protein
MTGGKKTQQESEQPAKVYQLDALEAKVDVVIGKLDEIRDNTSGMVTQSQLEATKLSLENKIDEEVKKIHLEYRPMKKNITWFTRSIVVQGVAILGQAVMMAFLWMTSRGN